VVGPPRLERGSPGLEGQWRMFEATLFSGDCGATHAIYVLAVTAAWRIRRCSDTFAGRGAESIEKATSHTCAPPTQCCL